ncbi:hypothetical protein BaRGS_00033005, partial [Batillaria attramentaria]
MARALATDNLTGLFGADNITVFLPTSEAFFTFQANAEWFAFNPDDPSYLETVLLYSSGTSSVVQGRYLVSDLPGEVTATLPSRLDRTLPLYINNLDTKFGKVLTINGARLLKSDIEADNGVIHVIDRALAPVAHRSTLATYVERPPLQQFSFTSIYLARAVVPDLTLETNRTDAFFTSFSPNDSYITIMPEYGKAPLFENWDLLRLVYEAHVVRGNALFIPEGVVPNDTTAIRGTLRFSRHGGHTYVSNGRVRARVIQPNVPVLNGVLHVIDNLLYYVYRDIVQMVQSLPNTRKMSQLLSLDVSLSSILKQQDRNFTVFVPTDFAFSKIPTSIQQRLDVADDFLRMVIMGHIITDVTLDADDMKQQNIMTAMNGNVIRVIQDDGETYLQWGNLRSKVEVTDLGVTNGVVHLIDSVLFLNNFTVWEAMSHMPLLSRMRELTLHFDDVMGVLSSPSSHATVFLASDDAMGRAQTHIHTLMRSQRARVYEAVRGHIVLHTIGSHEIQSPMDVTTMAGSTITITQEREIIHVTGSHVTARVTVKNVWCSNGVIYVIDEILHLPTRTVAEELNKRPNLVYMRMLFETLSGEAIDLNDTSRNITLFVADNDAFSVLPWPSIDMLMRELDRTRMILRAHVVPDETRYLTDIPDGERLPAAQNGVYVWRENGK